jgi:DNA-directed RNA polymerase specialized sigma subunit
MVYQQDYWILQKVPICALYFALEQYNPLSGSNLSIYAIDYKAIMDRSLDYIKKDTKFSESRASVHLQRDKVFDEVVDRFAFDILWIKESLEFNIRMDRQSGTFLFSGN